MSTTAVDYRVNAALQAADIARVFEASGITRPSHDLPRIARMFAPPSLVVSAWVEGRLVGVARSLTDHAYCCYLSDLAVDKAYQGQGIGKALIARTQALAGDEASLILIAAPGAASYYPGVGFTRAEHAFIIKRRR